MRRSVLTALAAMLLSGCAGTEVEPSQSPSPDPVQLRTVELSNGADRPLPTAIYQPSASGQYPLLVFSHGFTRNVEDYDVLLRHWAAAGYVVAAPTFPRTHGGTADEDIMDLLNQPADVTVVVDELLKLAATDGDSLHGQIDASKIAASGHSLGGMTTVGLLGRWRDPRVSAGIVLAGSARDVGTEFSGEPASVFFVHGAVDRVVTREQGLAAYEAVPWSKAFLTLPTGDHLGPFIDPWDSNFEKVARSTTDFLDWRLNGDADARARLTALGEDLADELG